MMNLPNELVTTIIGFCNELTCLMIYQTSKYFEDYNLKLSKSPTTLAAREGRLEILKYLREIGYALDSGIYVVAARNGHTNIIEWANEENIKPNYSASREAILNGHLETYKWLISHGWSVSDADQAIRNAIKEDYFDILIYCFPFRKMSYDIIFQRAIANNRKSMVKWLHNQHPYKCSNATVIACANGKLEILKWLVKHEYPLNQKCCLSSALCEYEMSNDTRYIEIIEWIRIMKESKGYPHLPTLEWAKLVTTK